MKIAISSTGKDLDGEVDKVFGRCAYFLIVEIKDKKIKSFEAIKNTGASQMGGAGISAAQTVAEKDVNAVISGNLGPKAVDVLNQFNIKMYAGAGLVKEVLQKFIDGKLEEIRR
jgi:predicted Fe-Mo cluster-binding NifX family protein